LWDTHSNVEPDVLQQRKRKFRPTDFLAPPLRTERGCRLMAAKKKKAGKKAAPKKKAAAKKKK
jgi:hypothetical protein